MSSRAFSAGRDSLFRTALAAQSAFRCLLGGDTAHIGHHVVFHLPGHGLFNIFSSDIDRRGRADIGPRGHGRHVRSQNDHHAGRSGPGAAGGNENDHRNPGIEQSLDDGPHGGIQTARRVQLNDQGGGVVLFRPDDLPNDEFGHRRIDRTGQGHHRYRFPRKGLRGEAPIRGRTAGRQTQEKDQDGQGDDEFLVFP